MFGYAVADPEKLDLNARSHYRAVYCGVCRALGRDRSRFCRAALTYDVVLLALVHSSVSGAPFASSVIRCGVHPLKPHICMENEHTCFAADMNVLLAFYNFLDDLSDDGGFVPAAEAALFWNAADAVRARYPALSDTVRDCLKTISDAERRDERRPDVPAAAFGILLGSIFAYPELPCKKDLYAFGESLGRAIYYMDAAVDVKADLKKKRYNPLITIPATERVALLELQLADCMEKLAALPLSTDKEIAENVLLSGIWTKYDAQKGLRTASAAAERGSADGNGSL